MALSKTSRLLNISDDGRSLLPLTILVVGIVALLLLGRIVLPFLFGALFAFVWSPLIPNADTPRWKRDLAAAGATLATIAITAVFIAVVVTFLADKAAALIEALPGIATDVMNSLQNYEGPFSASVVSAATDFQHGENLGAFLPSSGTVTALMTRIAGGMISTVFLVILTPFAMFYFLRDGDRLMAYARSWFRPEGQKALADFSKQSRSRLGHYVWGQTLIILSQMIFHTAGLLLLGLNYAVPIGIMTGLSAIVPTIGNLVMFSLAMIVGATQFGSLTPLIGIVAVYATSQVIEMFILTPYFIGERIKIHPLMVILVVLAAGANFGILGAFLALPLTAIGAFALERLHRGGSGKDEAPNTRRSSEPNDSLNLKQSV